jgi:hypothetical protein
MPSRKEHILILIIHNYKRFNYKLLVDLLKNQELCLTVASISRKRLWRIPAGHLSWYIIQKTVTVQEQKQKV